jgi:RNA polymerase sigma factor (sigma-70 family)
MQLTGASDASLVIAAQSGDQRARDELVRAALPLVYTIVGRALSRPTDVDDVVQDTMLRVVRDLRTLRAPESFRSWLAAIAIRQVGTNRRRRHAAASHTAALDEAAELADAAFENATELRVQLSGQRRQVERAGRWLDPDERALLSLWWLETAGELTRGELATAIGTSLAHAGVRVQRMRQHLELSRALVVALDATPRCAALDAVVAGWDGRPSPLWRKRIARHTRDCPVCARASAELVPTERLLAEYGLVPVPPALTAALADLTAVGAEGLVGHLVQTLATHPITALVAAAAIAAGTTATTTVWPTRNQAAQATTAAPLSGIGASPASRAPARLALGPVSLESANQAGQYVALVGTFGVLTPAGDEPTRRQATFDVVTGLADSACFTFRTRDGGYLRHSSWRLRQSANQGTVLFRGDATFCVRAGAVADTVALESSNYPGWYLRHVGNELWVDRSDGSAAFRADSSFRVRPALAN